MRAASVYRVASPQLDELVRLAAENAGTSHLHIGAQWLFEGVAWFAASAAVQAALAGRPVPNLAPESVSLDVSGGAVMALVLEGGDGAGVVEELEGHLAPLVDALVASRLRPRGALWRSAGDRVVQAALWHGRDAPGPERATAFARSLVLPPRPWAVPVRIASGADGAPMVLRASCCLAHRIPGGEPCDSCPLTRREATQLARRSR